MTVTKMSPDREERRRRQKELADQLKESGALDGIFAKIDAGEPLTGQDGLLGGMLKAALERGLETELTEHVGYERGAADASLFPNSRNGTSPKTVATEIGDIELGFPAGATTPSDANSTGLAIAALKALGHVPDDSASTALRGFQIGDSAPASDRGAFFYTHADQSPNSYATLDAVTALFDGVWPHVVVATHG